MMRYVLSLILILAICRPTTAGQDAGVEFSFESSEALALLREVRIAHGLTIPTPIALIGSRTSGQMTDPYVVVIDPRGSYQRGDVRPRSDGSTSTKHVTHVVNGTIYRQLPPSSPALAGVARPRLENEFTLVSITVLLRPRRGQLMTVRAEPEALFQGERMKRLQVVKDGQPVCTLFIRKKGSTLAGWSTVAETSGGTLPRVVVVEATKTVEGMRIPSRLRERTGPAYVAEFAFTTVLAGADALREFAGSK